MAAPFEFKTSIQSVQITGVKARGLDELHAGLRQVDGSSVYHHTYRHLRTLHFLPNFYRSDFSRWIAEDLKAFACAERMEALDLRDFTSIRELREELLRILEAARDDVEGWTRKVPAGSEFYFCRSTSIVLPAGYRAKTVDEFLAALKEVDLGCLFYHLVEAPLHISRDSGYRNDISEWLAGEWGLKEIADSVMGINPYLHDLEHLRRALIEKCGGNFISQAWRRVLARHESEDSQIPTEGWLARMTKRSGRKD